MSLIRVDPFRELESVSNRLSRLFGGRDDLDGFGNWAPAMDVEETDKEYVVRTDLPDVKKSNVTINIEDGVLAIAGERRQEKEEKTKRYHRVERTYGKFERRVGLPPNVEPSQVSAEFKDGVLVVRLPKSAAGGTRAVDVKIA